MGKKKVPINIVFIGHVNSGKSTTAGHLIYKQGGIDKSAVERFEKEAAKPNKYAWVLDRLKSEHERGITIDIDMYKFETTEYYCTVIDAPGDKDSFLKTMISGTSQPDCVVLVIDSTTSGFETGLDRQARALVHLSFVFGVKNLICCCNKMDATIPKYSEKRFLDIVLKLMPFLWMVGYNQDETLFIPISALDGDNLTQSSTNIPWYKGLTLLEALHQVNDPKKRISRRPLIKAGRNTAWENGITLRTVWENALDVGANIQSNCSDLEPRKKMRTDSEPHLDEKQVSSIVEKIKQVIMASSTRDDDDEDEVFDDDDEEIKLLKEKNKQEVELFDNVGDCLGTLIKMFKASFLSFFEEISSYLTPMFGKNKTSEERRIAVRIFCDIAEHCREAAHKYYGSFLPFLLEACNDECSDVRQVAVNGIDVCAQFGGSVFEPFVEEALSTLSKLIDVITVDSDNVMECENAHSVFNKIRNLHD